MGQIIIGTNSDPAFPSTFSGSIIERRATWADAWELDPELTVVSCAVHASSSQVSTCEVIRRYGEVKEPQEADFTGKTPIDLTGQLLRWSIIGDQGPVVVFVGTIENQARWLEGSETSPSGQQRWVAMGGLRLLQKIEISRSKFYDPDTSTVSTVEWIPGMNVRDHKSTLVGNKIENGAGKGFYGTPAHPDGNPLGQWTHLEYLFYLIDNFIQQTGGPTWTIGGQTDVLADMRTSIHFPAAATAAEMIKMLIPGKDGIDWYVKPTDAGYEITVFALSDEDGAIAGVTMPKNPNTVVVRKSNELNMLTVHIVESGERRYDRVEVIGKRIVVCGSLYAGTAGTLVKRWSDALETRYKTAEGAPTDGNTKTMDLIRKNNVFAPVYSHFSAPDDWDLDGGQWAIDCSDSGEIGTNASHNPNSYQNKVRETLGYIPLHSGFDYTQDPAVDNTDGEDQPDRTHPMAFIYLENSKDGVDAQHVVAHKVGLGVSVPYNAWGVHIHTEPAYALALNHWSDEELTFTTEGKTAQQYDWTTLIATIAIESDHRLRLAYSIPGSLAAGDGSVLTLVDESCECWVLLAGTVVDIDKDGHPATSGDSDRILRNDVSRLALICAGAIARYVNERVRAMIVYKGFQPWGDLVGNVLDVIQQGEDTTRVGAPITSCEWILNPQPTTTIKTGFA